MHTQTHTHTTNLDIMKNTDEWLEVNVNVLKHKVQNKFCLFALPLFHIHQPNFIINHQAISTNPKGHKIKKLSTQYAIADEENLQIHT